MSMDPPRVPAKAVPTALPAMVDIGANLLDTMFQGEYHGKKAHEADLDQVLIRSRRAGVVQQIVTAGSLQETQQALNLVAQHDDLFCTAGCHPTRASELEQHSGGSEAYISELESLINAHRNSRGAARKVVAVGECGLDYDRLFFSPADAQKAAFNAQLHLARRVRLPLFLHSRAAHDDLVAILRPHMKELREAIGGPVGVVHSFDGSVAEMQELIGLGLYIGLNGCSLRTKENLEVAQAVPLNSLMIETDAPWCELRPTHASAPILQAFKDRVLPPPPAGANTGKKAKGQPQALDPASSTSSATDAERAQALAYFLPQVKKEKWTVGSSVKSRNEPAATGQVALVIAGLKNISVEEVAQQTTRNARSVFSL